MKIIRLRRGDEYWAKTLLFAQTCSWTAGKHLAAMMREDRFSDWECVFAAAEKGEIVGFCTFLKEDYYPENRYMPWISTMFVSEKRRGEGICGKLIEKAAEYAAGERISRVYLPSAKKGTLRKIPIYPIESLINYKGARPPFLCGNCRGKGRKRNADDRLYFFGKRIDGRGAAF